MKTRKRVFVAGPTFFLGHDNSQVLWVTKVMLRIMYKKEVNAIVKKLLKSTID